MFLAVYTALHVAISLIAIATGLVVLSAFLTGRVVERATRVFLWATVATSVTGFGFPSAQLLPSHIVGAISLVVLALAIPARLSFHLAGRWRAVYAIGAVVALYLNVFVLVVQLFLKVPVLNALAPTQTEPAFAVAQLATLGVFVAVGSVAVVRFVRRRRDEPAPMLT